MYIIEGTIGAGKSTFLKLIAPFFPEMAIVYEPLHAWQNNTESPSLLEHFYREPQRWAYTMETLIMISRVQEHLKEQNNSSCIKLMERSIYSGHYCFTYNSYQQGFLTELEWNIYLAWFNFLIPQKCRAPRGFIYLQVDPEIAHGRIKKRSRKGEDAIPLEYLKQLDKRHTDFLIHKNNILPELMTVPVLVLNCNKEFEADSQEFLGHVEKVRSFMYQGVIKSVSDHIFNLPSPYIL